MEQIVPIHDESQHNHRRHSRHLSNLNAGAVSLPSSVQRDDESEEPQQPGQARKMSFQEIPYSLAWSLSEGGTRTEEDDRQDDAGLTKSNPNSDEEENGRERLLSSGDEQSQSRREQLVTFEGSSSVHGEECSGVEVAPRSQVFSLDEELPMEREPCFRGIVGNSCPTMPSVDGLMDDSDRLDLLLRRTQAFCDDTSERGYSRRRSSSMDESTGSRRVRRFQRIDSMLIDSKYGQGLEALEDSPKSTYVYWEENLNSSSAPSSPFASAFRETLA